MLQSHAAVIAFLILLMYISMRLQKTAKKLDRTEEFLQDSELLISDINDGELTHGELVEKFCDLQDDYTGECRQDVFKNKIIEIKHQLYHLTYDKELSTV